MKVKIWSAVAATVAVPTTSAHGVALNRGSDTLPYGDGFEFSSEPGDDEYTLLLKITGSASVITASGLMLYGWSNYAEDWFKLCDLNGAGALAETSSDKITYSEQVRGIRNFTRIQLVGTLAGSDLVANSWLVRR